MGRILCVMCVFGLAAVAGGAEAAPPAGDAESTRTAAYLALVRADEAHGSGRAADARRGYTDARDLYLQLREVFPDWQPDIVAYRVSYCEEQLDRLPGDADAPGAGESELEELVHESARTETRYLKQRIRELEEEMGTAAEGGKWRERADALAEENDALRRNLVAMRSRVTSAESGLVSASSLERENRDLQTLVNQQQARLEEFQTLESRAREAEQHLEAAQSRMRRMQLALKGAEAEASDTREREEKLRVLDAKLRVIRDARDRLAEEAEGIEGRLASMESEIDEARAARATAEKAMAAALAESQEFVKANTDLRAEMEASAAEFRDATGRLTAAEAAARDRDALVADLEAELDEANRTRIDLEKRLAESTKQLLEMEGRLADRWTGENEVRAALAKQRETCATLTRELQESEVLASGYRIDRDRARSALLVASNLLAEANVAPVPRRAEAGTSLRENGATLEE